MLSQHPIAAQQEGCLAQVGDLCCQGLVMSIRLRAALLKKCLNLPRTLWQASKGTRIRQGGPDEDKALAAHMLELVPNDQLLSEAAQLC